MLQQLIFTPSCICLLGIIRDNFFNSFLFNMAWMHNTNQRCIADGGSAPLGTKTLCIPTRVPPALNVSSRDANWIYIHILRGSSTHPLFGGWFSVPISCASVVGMFFFSLILSSTIRKSQRVDKDTRLILTRHPKIIASLRFPSVLPDCFQMSKRMSFNLQRAFYKLTHGHIIG